MNTETPERILESYMNKVRWELIWQLVSELYFSCIRNVVNIAVCQIALYARQIGRIYRSWKQFKTCKINQNYLIFTSEREGKAVTKVCVFCFIRRLKRRTVFETSHQIFCADMENVMRAASAAWVNFQSWGEFLNIWSFVVNALCVTI